MEIYHVGTLATSTLCLTLPEIESLLTSADGLAEAAEEKGNLTKSNSFRKSARAKKLELELIESEIKKLKENSN